VSQAAINVIVGERYKEVTDQVIQYALGIWGKEATEIMDADVKGKILSRARAKDWQAWEPSDLTLHQVRQKFGATISDEELLLRIYAGPDAVDALTAAGALKPQLDGKHSLLQLIEQLSKKKACNHIYIRRHDFTLAMRRSGQHKVHSGGTLQI
jgi:oxaloacetate decarboxylase alpha subunit